ncbi:hypothetical protein ACHAWO_001058 [Cyclotella atomus]|uniref:SAP domain-containing protein n=1 Tax=Cyclotella atomus TaxID=382360 RepID=A0ABD3PP24_9STRA
MYQPPSNSKKMLKLLKSAEDADVLSTVGAKIFLAHKAIMKDSLPILVDYCKCIKDPVGNNESIAARAIEGLSPKAFQLILEHIHAGSYPTDKDAIKCGKELIDAPNKFYLVELKMTVENILECALLYFVLHHKEVHKSERSKILRESRELLSEIIILMGNGGDRKDKSMSVAQLRNELGKRKLDVDGSKEALVLRLEEAKRHRTD